MKLNHVTKSHQSKVKRSEYRAAEMILMVIALFLISWTPYSLIACLGQFGDKSLLTPWVSVLPSLFAKMSTLYNPAIYGLSHRHFRAALKRMFDRDSRRNRSGTYFSKNSSLSKARTGCPCLPLNCTSDVLEDNSSSLTGKRIYVGSPQDNCIPVPDRKSYARENLSKLCVCGRVKLVSKDYISKLNDASACSQHIPTSAKLTCDHPTPCISVADSIYKHSFCGKECRSLMKLHVLDAQFDQRQEMPDQEESVTPETPCEGENLHCDQSTACMSVANSVYKHSFCGNSLIKLHVLDLHSDQRREMPGQDESASPENLHIGDNFECHPDAPCRCFHRFSSNNDFINPSMAKCSMKRPKSKMVPYKRRGLAMSMESGLVPDKSVPSVHHREISCSSAGSIHEFYDECYGCPVLCIRHEGKIDTERTVYRERKSRCGDMQWPSMCISQNGQSPLNPPCEFCESKGTKESFPSCNCENSESECESALSKTECCFDKLKICSLEVESERNLKLQKLSHNQLETTQNQNSKNLALSREELLMCNCKNKESKYESALLNQKCCNKFKTCVLEVESESNLKLPHNQLKSTPNQKSKILGLKHEELPMCLQCISNSCGDDFAIKNKSLSLSQEEAPMCLQCISNSCGDDFEPKKSYSNKGGHIPSVHPSLARSLMFRSEKSIHQKYQTICESDRIVKAGCLHSEFFGKRRRHIPETRRATVILEAGRMKDIIRSSSGNES
ncbi:hypothetical protein AVEN_248815-1 [Araneus ventricosus]|uniref:G-protein coupled receptors family 1 profile domain-containing protein n=1 Tax=Araneus ventricosus TaxID=182803 RepID=A0A4Y2J550_ARAVE|nr:hypothetical protein AVEN_248815-1 [Araneus ventricosus]